MLNPFSLEKTRPLMLEQLVFKILEVGGKEDGGKRTKREEPRTASERYSKKHLVEYDLRTPSVFGTQRNTESHFTIAPEHDHESIDGWEVGL